MRWKQLLTYITGLIDQELLRNEYLVTENRMLRQQIRGGVRLRERLWDARRSMRKHYPG
jgi:hypothetical protein